MTTDTGPATASPTGEYRDVLLDPTGRVVWDSGVRRNTIVADCRRLLCGFMHSGDTQTRGITGLQLGQGQDSWDRPPGPPLALPSDTKLADPAPYTVEASSLQIDYLSGPDVVDAPTNQLQIVATLGPNVPPWPDGTHVDRTLREFALVGSLGTQTVLIDYVIHPAIPRDPESTLKRTIRLVF
ncbi:hypothetical protein [Streptomyces palmae]|uniref:Uncharacterized protein n=1 Tax=Streptomyces palmae TaxID=1701085 RepID=A0A4Z0H1U3_9ACTN|nr:hypothetical protein [Streptomyces palmae]TGB03154.1 hypothetical protein E4099_19970 [Streptomyces palmae]